MVAEISMATAAHRAERLRRIRQLITELAPRDRDALHQQLVGEACALSSSKLLKA